MGPRALDVIAAAAAIGIVACQAYDRDAVSRDAAAETRGDGTPPRDLGVVDAWRADTGGDATVTLADMFEQPDPDAGADDVRVDDAAQPDQIDAVVQRPDDGTRDVATPDAVVMPDVITMPDVPPPRDVQPDVPVDATTLGPNLVANPSFETSTSGWQGYQAVPLVRVARADAPGGAYVVQASYGSGDYFTVDDNGETVHSIVAGQRYVAAAYVRAASASSVGKPVDLVLREWPPGGTGWVATRSARVALSNVFQRIEVSRTIVNTGWNLDIHVSHMSAVPGDSMYVDEITVRRVLP